MKPKKNDFDIKPDTIDGYYEEEVYSKGLDREGTIENQIRTCTYFYSRGMWNEFEFSLKALISLLPTLLRKRFKPLPHDVKTDGIEQHFEQFILIQETLENDTNMIFKKKFIKTYE